MKTLLFESYSAHEGRLFSERLTIVPQDALKGSFTDFLQALPHIETKLQDDGSFAQGKLVFRMKPYPPVEERKMFIKTFKLTKREDLWRICHKAPCAVVEIPEIEFEIGADAKRKIDSIYNHIASAVYNLSMHVSMMGEGISSDQRERICETIESLNTLLDVEKPWTFMLHDRTGLRCPSQHSSIATIPATTSLAITSPLSLAPSFVALILLLRARLPSLLAEEVSPLRSAPTPNPSPALHTPAATDSEIRPEEDVDTVEGGPAEEDPEEQREREEAAQLDAILEAEADDGDDGEAGDGGAAAALEDKLTVNEVD